ncbi:MAG: RNB domain-containing ribonuclease [Lentisphaeria bacterium]|nr:RNB domain-containing ribonuclease [Lentisphaeria bacterium]
MAKSGKSTRRRTPRLGTYSGHFRGFGFFVPDLGGDDLFIPPGREGDAIDGDTVEVIPAGGGTARVSRVVKRGRARLAGTCIGKGKFSPDAHHIGKILSVYGTAEKGDKILVVPDQDGFRIDRILGRSGAREVEDAAVLAELDIAPDFPAAVLAAAAALPGPSDHDVRGRLDLRQALTVVTIDPSTSRDFDDAISIQEDGNAWILGVHIADVSHYVKPGSTIDQEARKRGTSVYLPGQVIPMLPERLSNDLCSLREGRDRLALSVLLRYDLNGQLLETTFAESVIRPNRRFSYERASRVMDGSRREKGVVGEVLQKMLSLAEILKNRRCSLDLPRDDTELVFDATGHVVDLRSIVKDVAHGVIEEFMLAANREVARLMLGLNVPTLFRHHPAPEDLTPVWETLSLLGMEDARKVDLSGAVKKATREGYGPTIASAVFRCMSRARYTTRYSDHFSLAFDAYCHFTSPIRRYTDLVVHRALREAIQANHGPIVVTERGGKRIPGPVFSEHLEALGEGLNALSAAAERAESRIRRQRVLEFLIRQGAIPTVAQITGVVEKGLIMSLTEYGVSGFLAFDMLPKDDYTFAPGVLKGTKKTYALGQELDVCIHRIDPAASQLDLALAPRY